MSKQQKYALELSKNALRKAGGNTKQAEAILREQLKRDPDLLLGLAEPYLNGILTHALQRAAKGLPLSDQPAKEVVKKQEALPKTKLSDIQRSTNKPLPKQGMDGLIKALAGTMDKKDKSGATAKPSQAHIDAINQMAKFTIKKKNK